MDVNQRPPRAGGEVAGSLYAVIRLVRPLHRALARAVEEQLAGSGISTGLRALLERLEDSGPQSVPAAARALALPRQVVQRLADAAVLRGLLHLVPNAAHARSALLVPTPAGRVAFRRLRAREQRLLARAGRPLSPRDVAACLRVVSHLARTFGALPGEEPGP